jgi:hypothetical protein
MSGGGALVSPLLALACWGCGSDPAPALAGPRGRTQALRMPDPRTSASSWQRCPAWSSLGEQGGGVAGYRRFDLTFEQPVDSCGSRRAALQATTGAPLSRRGCPHRPGDRRLLLAPAHPGPSWRRWSTATSSRSMHRYFASSIPDSPGRLGLGSTSDRRADDHHASSSPSGLVLTGRWISTGSEQGGMAAVFHRRFHPSDVDGTVGVLRAHRLRGGPAARSQNRFLRVSSVRWGPTPRVDRPCATSRSRSSNAGRRCWTGWPSTPTQQGIAWNQLGTEKALEFAVEDTPFVFWQYGAASRCAAIPRPRRRRCLFTFLDLTVEVRIYSDVELARFAPYYYTGRGSAGVPHRGMRAT